MAHDWSALASSGHRFVVTLVRAAEQIVKTADRFLAPYRLSLAQFNILTVLSSRPDGLQQVELGRLLVVSRANVTGLVRRLAARGLCAVASQPGDARVKRVSITASGRRLLGRIEEPYLLRIERLTSSFSAGDMDSASRLLDELAQAVSALPEVARPGRRPSPARRRGPHPR